MLALVAAPLAIFPLPTFVSVGEGSFRGKPSIAFAGEVGKTEQKWLKTSLQEFMPADSRSKDTLTFRLDPAVAGDEGYRLVVTPHAIDLSASTTKGLYWSLQTLRQLRRNEEVPCLEIRDSPAFAWRGVLLDEGRHFMGPKFVKRFLDVMSLYKFNVLHWHLTDDQGWRIEIKSHPELTKIGAWRREADGSRTGGFYTQKQIKEIVAYAALRNIEIVPEIEMPGHSSAAIASLPSLGCTGKKIEVPATWGVFGDVYCAGKESTFSFLNDVLSEVTKLFPSQYLHLGGDEVPKSSWKGCPKCQARIKAEGLKDEEALQGYFTHRIAKMVGEKGRIPIGWDEVLHGGAPDNMVVQIWEDQAISKGAIDTGHKIILSPDSHCYLNHSPGDLPLSKVYGYDPMRGISDDAAVLGMETTLWSENITTKNCLAMLMPRGLAMSEIFWGSPKQDMITFEGRVNDHLSFMDKLGIEYGSPDRNLVQYTAKPQTGAGTCRLEALYGMPGVELRYTLDGALPIAASARAESSIEWPVGKTLRVAPFKSGKQLQDAVTFQTATSLAYGAKVSFEAEPLDPYRAAGPQGLTDGLLGTGQFRDDIWLGWQGSDMVATCDLGKDVAIHEIGLHCLQQMRSWILMPSAVRYEVSSDGDSWTPFGEVRNSVPDTTEPWTTDWFTAKGSVRARYVRITAINYGRLPAWHNGAGGDAWIFVDELAVR